MLSFQLPTPTYYEPYWGNDDARDPFHQIRMGWADTVINMHVFNSELWQMKVIYYLFMIENGHHKYSKSYIWMNLIKELEPAGEFEIHVGRPPCTSTVIRFTRTPRHDFHLSIRMEREDTFLLSRAYILSLHNPFLAHCRPHGPYWGGGRTPGFEVVPQYLYGE